ncbi:hypothetical protein, partial [Calothrix sp. 336/3]|uniref:hypothetical protein n=1 Tax=Calothrix sp. 336/3 TaxID=1337936 RepID=UPI0005514E71
TALLEALRGTYCQHVVQVTEEPFISLQTIPLHRGRKLVNYCASKTTDGNHFTNYSPSPGTKTLALAHRSVD